MSTLYIVGTPIGNLEDLTIRAKRVLCSVSVVFAEDTRVTTRLLNRIGASPLLVSFEQHSTDRKLQKLLEFLKNKDVALLTDAGTPCISDPGAEAVSIAVENGHTVCPLPGVSAVTAAISVSGFTASRFVFLGFIPRDSQKRRDVLIEASREIGPTVMFEAPHRLHKTLKLLEDIAPTRQISVSRELTKIHEEVFNGNATQALAHFNKPKGEFVIVMDGNKDALDATLDKDISNSLAILSAQGFSGKRLVEEVALRSGASRSRIYRIHLNSSK